MRRGRAVSASANLRLLTQTCDASPYRGMLRVGARNSNWGTPTGRTNLLLRFGLGLPVFPCIRSTRSGPRRQEPVAWIPVQVAVGTEEPHLRCSTPDGGHSAARSGRFTCDQHLPDTGLARRNLTQRLSGAPPIPPARHRWMTGRRSQELPWTPQVSSLAVTRGPHDFRRRLRGRTLVRPRPRGCRARHTHSETQPLTPSMSPWPSPTRPLTANALSDQLRLRCSTP
jgi:hypothetical protein